MSATSAINSLVNTGSNAVRENKTGLGKEDFLQLLVAQLQHQDPLNPSDPTEFTAQLAQFSSLEQLFNVNETLEKVNTSNAELERLTSLSMLGREIVSEASNFRLEKDGTVKLGYQLENSVASVQVHIQDSLNRTVATINANQTNPGEHWLAWNGSDANGQVAPPGDYKLVVSALDGKENPMDVLPLVSGVVTGIEIAKQGNRLTTTCGDYSLNSIKSVKY